MKFSVRASALPFALIGLVGGCSSATISATSARAAIQPFASGPVAVAGMDGSFECFPEGSTFIEKTPEGAETKKPYTCEPSAIYSLAEGSFFALNDKPVELEGYSQHFEVSVKAGAARLAQGRPSKDIQAVKKFEGVTVTSDGKWVVATAAFDRDKKGYNSLLAWPVGRSGESREVNAPKGFASVREWLAKAVGTAYFKIEGLASTPEKTLLFGVRETGKTFQDFDYGVTVLEAPFEVDPKEGVRLTGELKTVFSKHYSWSPQGIPGAEIGISSLEYDAHTGRIYALVSSEPKETATQRGAQKVDDFSSHLLVWKLEDLRKGQEPRIALNAAGQPLDLVMKAEGLAVLPKGKLMVIFDNDRQTGVSQRYDGKVRDRKLHEGIYRFIEVL